MSNPINNHYYAQYWHWAYYKHTRFIAVNNELNFSKILWSTKHFIAYNQDNKDPQYFFGMLYMIFNLKLEMYFIVSKTTYKLQTYLNIKIIFYSIKHLNFNIMIWPWYKSIEENEFKNLFILLFYRSFSLQFWFKLH